MVEQIERVKKEIGLLEGRVVSDKMDKTVVVLIERKFRHLLYKKYIRRSKKIHAHDENNRYKLGDYVSIRSSRPHSKKKSWEVTALLQIK